MSFATNAVTVAAIVAVSQVPRAIAPVTDVACVYGLQMQAAAEALRARGAMPFAGYDLVGAVRAAHEGTKAPGGSGSARVVAVYGPKGGVGRTTVALNVALFEDPFLDFIGVAFTSLVFVQLLNIVSEVTHWNLILLISTAISLAWRRTLWIMAMT